ncbi:hypothetical protein EWM64_g1040 [Hericium alpestre]|uniref:Uncharacterized protein n=1 Tax=Hericium alpestre TaxID=135208 RepID=A0A4Z0A9G2_9AGAM|nr:hypothetical protein EWM64_g1040 [Hericium alpestre]
MSKAAPLSIESLLQKQKEEKEAAAKPKFLSKEERAKIAIAKRSQEIREERERAEQARKDREELEREAGQLRQQDRGDSRVWQMTTGTTVIVTETKGATDMDTDDGITATATGEATTDERSACTA